MNRAVQSETHLIKAKKKGCLLPVTARLLLQYLVLLLSRSADAKSQLSVANICLCTLTLSTVAPSLFPTGQDIGQEPTQEAQRCEAQGEEAQVPPVHSSGPEGREVSSTHGLGLRPPPAAAAALPTAADPEPAETRSHIFPDAAAAAHKRYRDTGSAEAACVQLPASPTGTEVSHTHTSP